MGDEKPWINDVITALLLLGGEGSLPDIYRSVASIRDVSLKKNWKASVRRTIEQHSSDSDAFTGQADLFYSARGIGNGRWGFRKHPTDRPFVQKENEETNQIQRRIATYVQKIVRSIKITKDLKRLHDNKCQLCGTRLEIAHRVYYSEGHHIKPLGKPYDGPDTEENILIVCPNCHVLCDNRAIRLPDSLHTKGRIGKEFIDFHNELHNKKNRQ